MNGVIKFSVVSLWFVTMGWLIRFEAFSHLFDPTLQGYREMSKSLPALRDSWMKIVADGQHVGYINSSIEMVDFDGEEQLHMGTQIMIKVWMNGGLELCRLSNKVELDSRQKLMGSISNFSIGSYTGKLTAEPLADKNSFMFSFQLNDLTFKREMSLPEGAVISSPVMDAGLRSVKVGHTVKIRSLDAFLPSWEVQTVELTGLSSTHITLPGESREVEVTTVAMKMGEIVVEADVDEYGRILRQETPFGLTFIQAEAGDAMKVPKGQGFNPMDLLTSEFFSPLLKLPGPL
ncbi:hypothetical protein P0Y35_02850 [Kiritimatiellaeota bacterium B1221]|nr:hypothetical protein [Kiritimatiellaeota bacterium B1221]